MQNQIDYQKSGKVEVKCERSFFSYYKNYKSRDMVVHSTLLSINKRIGDITDDARLQFIVDPNRALNDPTYRIRDFLLAPLGNTEITQVGEALLVLVSKRKISKNSDNNEVVTTKQSAVFQQLTLKFQSRVEREEWMKAIIAECDKNYLKGLLNSNEFDGFVESANKEIWSAILLGDEALRKAYVAPIGSDNYELVRIVVTIVIDWIQLLLGPSLVQISPEQKEIFVAIFSLMMQDTAARALLILVRPDPAFLKDFQKDTAAGEYVFPGDKNNEKTEAEIMELEMRATALSFVDSVKLKVVQSPAWRRYRAFLSVVDHPAWPQGSTTTAAYDDCHEIAPSPTEELRWMKTVIARGPSEFSWAMFRSGIDNSPYLSYFFITQEISDSIDDIRVHKVLQLLKRVPPNQLSMTFTVDFVLKPLRQHFLALVDYCKFRELWKAFYYEHSDSPDQLSNSWKKSFFDEVHKQIWAHIIMSPDPSICKVFLPTAVAPTEAMTFSDVLGHEVAHADDPNLLKSLNISVSPAYVHSPKATAAFRSLAVDRLVLWVQSIAGRTELTVADASIFVHILVAITNSPIVRAVLWLVLPSNDSSCHNVTGFEGLQYTERFINSLLSQSDLSCRQGGFLSFLTMCEHPLARAVGVDHPVEPASPAMIAAVPLSIASTVLTWDEEMEWMERYSRKGWLFSWSELELLQQPSPYLSLNILIRLYQEGAENLLMCVELMRALRPKSLLDARFQANVNFSDLQFITHVTVGAHFDSLRQHFLVLVDYSKFRELWKAFYYEHSDSPDQLSNSWKKSFFDEVHKQIWAHIIMSPDPCICKVFLPTAVAPTEAMTFSDVLGHEVAHADDPNLLKSLNISVSPAYVHSPKATAAFRSLAVDRLVLWVQSIAGRTELTAADASIFVHILVAITNSPIVRAVLWLVLPSNDSSCHNVTGFEGLRYTERLINSLLSQSDLSCRQGGFLSFLTMCEHPLARAMGVDHPVEPASPAMIAAVPLSIASTVLTWDEEMEWMERYSRKGWLFSWSELELLQQPSPYLSLNILIRLYQEGVENVVPCVHLMRALRPKSLLDARFQANVNFNTLQFCSQVTTGAHFHTLMESRRVVRIWHVISTQFLNSSPRFAEGVCSHLVEMLICRRSAPVQITFDGIISILVSMELNCDDETRRILFDTANNFDNITTTAPLPSITNEHMAEFKSYLDRLVRWWMTTNGTESQVMDDSAGIAFAKVFHACLDSALLRAICVIVKPSGRAPADSAVLSEFFLFIERNKRNYYFLYFLQLLQHPGIQDSVNNGILQFSEPNWDEESNWLKSCSSIPKLDFDHTDFILLIKDPAYLLFRYLKIFFSQMGNNEKVSRVVAIIEGMTPGSSGRIFEARANYPSCLHHPHDQVMIPDTDAHFMKMLKYCLFFQLWGTVMSKIGAAPSFRDAAMYATWLLVTRNAHSPLSKLLLHLEVNEQDNQSTILTYLKVVQRHAIYTIRNVKKLALPQLSYFALSLQDDSGIVTDEELQSHHLLMNRILKWTRCLLGEKAEDAPLFADIFAAATSDVAMRAILTTFVAAPSTVRAFMRSNKYEALVYESRDDGSAPSAAVLLDAAQQFIRLLARTLRSEGWRQFRCFMDVLEHPVEHAGIKEEMEPSWIAEAAWIQKRLQMVPATVDWHEWEFVLHDSPYISLVTVTKAFPLQQQEEAVQRISAEHLGASFAAQRYKNDSVALVAPHFIAMCLQEETQEFVLKAFKNQNLINDTFCEELLNVAYYNQRLPYAFSLLKSLLHTGDYSSPNSCWNANILERMPNVSIVIIKFLSKVGRQNTVILDEKLVGTLVVLVFQLESCNTGSDCKSEVSMQASEWMREDTYSRTMFFGMLTSLNFLKWFPKLCIKLNLQLGSEQDDGDYDSNVSSIGRFNLSISIFGFFSLCIEFQPEYLYDFVKSLGIGRPFFSHFVYCITELFDRIFRFFAMFLNFDTDSDLFNRIQERYIFYDNDHVNPSAVQAMGLRNPRNDSICLNLTDEEFTDLLTVAMYLHDTQNLSSRLEGVVRSMITDQEKRDIIANFMKWVIDIYITPDITEYNHQQPPSEINRTKWSNCARFRNVSFEDIMECAAEAAISSHVLRSAARSKSHDLLEQLFLHYIRSSDPSKWKDLFRGSKNIAYFIKYVDAEDLDLAFTKFLERNPENYYFRQHLLRVRKLLKEPIVSAQALIELTSSSDSDSATTFFEALTEKAKGLPRDQVELRIAMLLTASWMKISKEKVLFPLPPRNAQIITLLTVASWAKSLLGAEKNKQMGKALIAQVGTGEGKSLIIAMMAIFFVKTMKRRVHILENNPGLLEKDVETMKPLYAEFGIKTHQEDSSKPTLSWASTELRDNKDGRDGFARVGVTYCLRRNMERYYQDSILADIPGNPLANTVLIVDEVDDLIVDDVPNQLFASKDSQGATFQSACDYLKTNNGEIPERANGNSVWEVAERAYSRAQSMELNRDYAVKEGKYVILRDGKPVELYDYALEYLKYSLHNKPPVFRSNYYCQSIPYLLSQYECITGFSGSVGSPSERNFLKEQFKAWCFDSPSFLDTCPNVSKSPPTLMSDAVVSNNKPCVHVYRTTDHQTAKVIELCLRLHSKVPVLVIAKSTEEAIDLRDKLRASMRQSTTSETETDCIQLFLQYKVGTMTLDKENWGKMVRRATTRHSERGAFYITVTDPFGGRGHDFDVHDDEVNRLGGLAVIMTSIPASEREWIQWKGRTARKDNAGQYAVVLCSEGEDFPMSGSLEMLKDYAMVDEFDRAIPNIYNELLIGKLLAMRDEGQQSKLDGIGKDIVMGRRLNRLCDQFYREYGPMEEQSWPRNQFEVILRNLLCTPEIVPREIDKAFEDFDLLESDATVNDFEVPNVSDRLFWNEDDEAEWTQCFEGYRDNSQHVPIANHNHNTVASIAQNFESRITPMKNPLYMSARHHHHHQQQQQSQASDKAVLEAGPSPRPPQPRQRLGGNYHNTPLPPLPRSELSIAPPLPLVMEEPTCHEPQSQFIGSYQINHSVEVSHERALAAESQPKYSAPPPPPSRTQQQTHSVAPPPPPGVADNAVLTMDSSIHKRSRRQSGGNPRSSISSKSYDLLEYDEAADSAPLMSRRTEREIAEAKVVPNNNPSLPESDDLMLSGIDAPELNQTVPTAPRGRRNPGMRAADLIIMNSQAKADSKSSGGSAKQAAADSSKSSQGSETSKVATNHSSHAEASSNEKVAANNSSGITISTEKAAANLLRAKDTLLDHDRLTEICVGETKKVTNSLNYDLKMKLFDVADGNNGLVVGVYDITGPNAGRGVAYLEVTGAITKTASKYTLILSAKAQEIDQFRLSLYGRKRFEAKWNDVVVLFEEVTVKPPPKLRPNASFIFHNARNAEQITSQGQLTISSRDDPRSGPGSPVFPDIYLPYDGRTAVQLPRGLPDAMITITPDIRGFSNKRSEKFLLLNGEVNPTELKIIVSATDLSGSEWRVVLTWGQTPRDLDLYCVTNFKPSEIYFCNKNEGGRSNKKKGMIELDIDETSGFGPETITFTPLPDKKYRFFVRNYSNERALSESCANIVIHKGDGETLSFDIPTDIVVDDAGNHAVFWNVFELLDGAIRISNEVVAADLRKCKF